MKEKLEYVVLKNDKMIYIVKNMTEKKIILMIVMRSAAKQKRFS